MTLSHVASHRAVLPNQIGRRECAVEHGDLGGRALEVGVASQRCRSRTRPALGWARLRTPRAQQSNSDQRHANRHGPKTLEYVSSVSIRLTGPVARLRRASDYGAANR